MKAYLFDFDGTLVDSMPTYVAAMLRILDENEIPYTGELIKQITPLGVSATADYFISIGLPLQKESIISKMKAYMLDAYAFHIQAKTNVISTLEGLKKKGAKLNVLTASPHATLDPCLKRLGIFALFDHVWSCDDFATTKADPAIYVAAAEKIGEHMEDVLFLDDNLNALKTAKMAKMPVCGVYDATSEDVVCKMTTVSDKYIYSFNEL